MPSSEAFYSVPLLEPGRLERLLGLVAVGISTSSEGQGRCGSPRLPSEMSNLLLQELGCVCLPTATSLESIPSRCSAH